LKKSALAALLQKTHILAYDQYASAVRFFRALPPRFLNGLRNRAAAPAD